MQRHLAGRTTAPAGATTHTVLPRPFEIAPAAGRDTSRLLPDRPESAHRLGHSFESTRVAAPTATPPVAPANAPMQPMFEWLNPKNWGKKNELDEHSRLFEPSPEPILDWDEHERQQADLVADSNAGSKASVGASAGSAIASTGVKAADISKLFHAKNAADVSLGFGTVGPGISAIGSMVDAGIAGHKLATMKNLKTSDRVDTGMELASALGSATSNSALAIGNGMTWAGHAAPAVLGPIAGIGGVATGGFDMLRGGLGTYKAGRREQALDQLADNYQIDPRDGEKVYNTHNLEDHRFVQGIARFAREQQHTKKKANLATIGKGALAAGGGAALLLGGLTNPVGWALLGGAALVGGGIAAYKAYRKYQEGKKILHNADYRRQLQQANIDVPDAAKSAEISRMVAPRRWWNTMKMHDRTRGRIAHELSRPGNAASDVLEHVGLKHRWSIDKPPPEEIAKALDA